MDGILLNYLFLIICRRCLHEERADGPRLPRIREYPLALKKGIELAAKRLVTIVKNLCDTIRPFLRVSHARLARRSLLVQT